MTQKERIAMLEREVKDLRALVQALQARPAPFVPYTPPAHPQQPWASPNSAPRYPMGGTFTNVCAAA